ncbi:site-2 protease family protein [Spirulina sp. CCNP1310]|uniref:site-2 protease family protein n=1 Tax=Spirulina sp. CCNP1310 TaxID=3110249 RepID=UPI002B1F8B0F|nr:site-2 protease family protein [Spirulina sp. CCNP1310]MEA5419943.1 site-2 protease family protein [Spirulina sp. CCNP1310]
MEIVEILLLIFLGIISYLIVKRTVAQLTDTPIWLLWATLMAPPVFLSLWLVIMGDDQPLPLVVALLPFIVCTILYWWLIQRGRKTSVEPKAAIALTEPDSNQKPTNPNPLTAEEEKSLRNCFPWGIYYLQAVDYRPQAILCRGRLTTNPEVAYEKVRENVESKFGDRFLLIFQEGQPNKPFFALVPNPWNKTQTERHQEPLHRPLWASALFLITLFTTTVIGIEFAGIALKQVQTEPILLLQGLSYSLPLLLILGVHEFSHYGASLYYQVRTTLPYFIPMPFLLGTFGAFIQTRSPMPHRRALFDIAFAGPIGGFLLALPLLIWGLHLSTPVPLEETSSLLNFKSLDPRFSFLMAVLSKVTLGSEFGADMAIQLHPIAVAGYLGIIITALNLMPVGQLDGGHIVHAMFGQRMAMGIGQIARLLMLILGFVRSEFIIWAIFLLFMPNMDEPALNDVTELNQGRDLLGLAALTLLVVILLPLPGGVAQWLQV